MTNDGKFTVVVECAIEWNNKFLVIKRPLGVHAAGLFAFPGGKVEREDGIENNNILVEAVKREVLEEVGLNLIDLVQFITSSFFIDSHQHAVLDVIFHCQLHKTDPIVTVSPREVPEYAWLSMDEINAHQNSPLWLKRYISLVCDAND